MSLDLGVLIIALLGVTGMLVFQALILRRLDESGIFPALIQSVIAGFCATGAGLLGMAAWLHLSILEIILAGGCAAFIYALGALVYVLCIFGPFTTSVRIRLLREIGTAPGGLTQEELNGRYNDALILDIRLKRLIGSGYIAAVGKMYTLRRKDNVFHLMDVIADNLKVIIHGPKG